MAEPYENISLREEGNDDGNECENETTTYERLDLQNVDQAIYEDLRTETERNKEKDLHKKLRSVQVQVRRYKRVAVGVGLLCAVLALLNVAVPLCLYQTSMAERGRWVTSYDRLLDRADRLTRETDKLARERDRLLDRTDRLTEERGRLLNRTYDLTEERDRLLTRTDNLTAEGEELLARFDLLYARCNLTERDTKRIFCESDGFTFCGGLCYYVSTETKTWEESRQRCRDNQSDLIVINRKEKQDLVAGLNQRVWLGLTASDEEGSFQWVDGTPLTTPTYWGAGQPNHNGQCVEFNVKGKGWNDMPCSSNKTTQWICERV